MERWTEDSGNAALMGCELPRPRCWRRTSGSPPGRSNWARPGSRVTWTSSAARAYLDLLLGKDSRPRRSATGGGDGDVGPDSGPGVWPGSCRVRRAGHPDRPLGTAAGRADRPGRAGTARLHPWLARDLVVLLAQPEDDLAR